MSRKHAHRADNQPVTRRYVRSVVQRARDEILSAIVHVAPTPSPGLVFTTADETHTWAAPFVPDPFIGGTERGRVQSRLDRYVSPTPERIERAVNGTDLRWRNES